MRVRGAETRGTRVKAGGQRGFIRGRQGRDGTGMGEAWSEERGGWSMGDDRVATGAEAPSW